MGNINAFLNQSTIEKFEFEETYSEPEKALEVSE